MYVTSPRTVYIRLLRANSDVLFEQVAALTPESAFTCSVPLASGVKARELMLRVEADGANRGPSSLLGAAAPARRAPSLDDDDDDTNDDDQDHRAPAHAAR